jgi:hypothetical protein
MPRWRPSAEQVSARRGLVTLLNAAAAACFSFAAINGARTNPDGGAAYLLLWGLWMLVTLVWVFGVPGARRFSPADQAIINDELVRAHQAGAARVGFGLGVAMLAAGAACSFLGVAIPGWAPPAAGSVTIVGTALAFAWLQMRDD